MIISFSSFCLQIKPSVFDGLNLSRPVCICNFYTHIYIFVCTTITVTLYIWYYHIDAISSYSITIRVKFRIEEPINDGSQSKKLIT